MTSLPKAVLLGSHIVGELLLDTMMDACKVHENLILAVKELGIAVYRTRTSANYIRV